jgi:hypothetical protein
MDEEGFDSDRSMASSSVGPSRSPAAAKRSSRLEPGSPLNRIRSAARSAACGSDNPFDILISVRASSAFTKSRSSSRLLSPSPAMSEARLAAVRIGNHRGAEEIDLRGAALGAEPQILIGSGSWM